ncbi:trafficking regulator of GLUT4 1-like isoform X1 [Sceloporus undulatus]|uniref:trafficking regulator of GLUT4 1-like isoform X1 n=1 Tax=Sceloporus undulatus TaxID=8520 RepID=UPI001C4BC740|nr:trafficking regulator of GLUT4 1-like isoform X1 [Sceloporus undulatus]
MSDPKYEKLEEDEPDTQEPLASSEQKPYKETEPLKRHAGPQDPTGYGATLPKGSEYPRSYGTSSAGPYQTPGLLPPPGVSVRPIQTTEEPDYLCYSIFTMLCCCLPLGIAALVFSIQTRDANHRGDAASAQRNSRNARILAHTALGVGLVLLIVYIVLMVIMTKKIHEQNPPTGQ